MFHSYLFTYRAFICEAAVHSLSCTIITGIIFKDDPASFRMYISNAPITHAIPHLFLPQNLYEWRPIYQTIQCVVLNHHRLVDFLFFNQCNNRSAYFVLVFHCNCVGEPPIPLASPQWQVNNAKSMNFVSSFNKYVVRSFLIFLFVLFHEKLFLSQKIRFADGLSRNMNVWIVEFNCCVGCTGISRWVHAPQLWADPSEEDTVRNRYPKWSSHVRGRCTIVKSIEKSELCHLNNYSDWGE